MGTSYKREKNKRHPKGVSLRRGLLAITSLTVTLSLLHFAPSTEPSSNGKSLSEWMTDLQDPTASVTPELRAAILEIGADSVPFLIQELQAKDHWFKTLVNHLLDKLGYKMPQLARDLDRQEGAIRAFFILRSDASPAIPAISELLRQPEQLSIAGRALYAIGTNSLPALISACGHNNRIVRTHAAFVLAKITGDGGYTSSSLAVGSTNRIYRFAFGIHDGDIYTMVTNLSHPDVQVRRASLEALQERVNWNATKSIAPVVRNSLTDESATVREAARDFLDKIGSNNPPPEPGVGREF